MSVSLSKLKPFQKKCPYQLISMFNTNGNEDLEDLSDYLVYEVFPCDEDTKPFETFLKDDLKKAYDDNEQLASDMSDRGHKLQFLENYTDVSDNYYKKLWKNLEGAEKKRSFLYPINASDRERRLPDALYRQYSEIAVFKELIEQSGSYTWSATSQDDEYDGEYFWYIGDGFEDLYMIRPCCPKCRTLLPDYWFDEDNDDLVPIGLVAPHSGGKTTYMTSLLMDRFVPLLKDIGAGRWTVANAISNEKKCVPVQSVRYDNVARLSQGKYPLATEKNKLPPVMFRMSSNGRTIIVAIYDCAGERFEFNTDDDDDNKKNLQFLSHMSSIIYFMEAAQIKKDNLGSQFISDKPDLQPPDKQAEDQQNSDEVVYVRNLLQHGSKEAAFDMFIHVLNKIRQMETRRIQSSLKHVAFTIIKSDELKRISERLPAGFSVYLDNPMWDNNQNNLFNADYCQGITDDVADFINDFFGNRQTIDKLLEGTELTYSCHCVSVAPKAESTSGKECEYRPVRIAEPLVACLLDQFN